jgi:hypothetical protein
MASMFARAFTTSQPARAIVEGINSLNFSLMVFDVPEALG